MRSGKADLAPELIGVGIGEAQEARLGERVDGDDLRAVLLGMLKRGEHARMVGARVLPDDEDQVGQLEVLERDSPLPDAEALDRGRSRDDS